MLKNAVINRGVIRKIALALGPLNEHVVFVGGATVGLYIDDPAAEDVRPTKDVDISLSIATLGELEAIREDLTRKGFKQSSEDHVICRFRYEDIIYVLDNRTDIVEQLTASPEDVKPYLIAQLQNIGSNRVMQEAIFGNLYYETREVRYKRLMDGIHRITGEV